MNNDKNIIETALDPELSDQLRALVIERINVMPDTLRIAIGSDEVTKSEILEHISQGDEIGKQMIEMELDFLRALASGAVYEGR